MSYGSKLSPKQVQDSCFQLVFYLLAFLMNESMYLIVGFQDKTLKIKEVFAILTQGVEMIHYDTDRSNNRASKSTKVVWMVSGLCLDFLTLQLSSILPGQ